MADNRVVIKINYDKDKQRKAIIDPKIVTVWHTGRIFSAIFILLLLLAGIVYIFSGNETEENPAPADDNIKSAEITSLQAPAILEAEPAKTPLLPPNSNTRNAELVKRPAAIIYDRRVIRASLNGAPKNDEPGEPIKQPLTPGAGESTELFYFSQIKNLNGNTLFHVWYKDGRLVNKKQFEVKAANAKLISSRKLTLKDAGEWQVLLTDIKGKKFSEAYFSVNH
ncbi:DUF2914 domain-containing protein [Methylomonas sp. SURF-2]|uniref:DUF2914 domain-containing protein n=1 Tax=Methylomonas subterranea TaxID=2952225 RepID=A0ABT1TBG7_9GAMM|nr:DUF2914 domain-containing protein [Methylomonas sp. SURF-2]MCQ8102806.1 DUF2914 domain-containing protein [Methylomonas sp. SURF-2]